MAKMAHDKNQASLQLLYNISRELAMAINLGSVLPRVLALSLENVGGERGTIVVFDESGKPVDEKSPWEPGTERSPYAISKYYAEREVWRGMGEGLSTLIVNPSTILGYGDWEASSNRLFRNAFDSFPWYTEGENGFVDVRDVARAVTALMDSGRRDERFLVSAENWSYRKLFTRMAEAFGKKPPGRLAGPFLSGLAWRMEKIKSGISGKKPLLTRETAAIARNKTVYNNRKLLDALPGFVYTPLEDSIRQACARYLAVSDRKPA